MQYFPLHISTPNYGWTDRQTGTKWPIIVFNIKHTYSRKSVGPATMVLFLVLYYAEECITSAHLVNNEIQNK
jgi:hypothetical protein